MSIDHVAESPPALRRSLSLPLLVLYGLGTTVGAGIYALTGKIAGLAGMWAPASFALSCVLAGFTALSFGELASRYPRSAGVAVYLEAGFERRFVAQLGGGLVCLSAATSSGTLALAAVGYLGDLVPIQPNVALAVLLLTLSGIACWGIRESVTIAGILTVAEVGGVLAVTVAGAWFLGGGGGPATPAPAASPVVWVGVLSGAVLGFYAFLGFEDMVHVAEEVKQARRTVPRAIVLTLAITTALYLALAADAVRTVAPATLAASDAPLTLVYDTAGGPVPQAIGIIALLGMLNGILIQLIMGSRLLYGLASEGAAPRCLGRVHPRTRTPLLATAAITAVVLGFALLLPLESLARGTSWLTLALFAAINTALYRIKGRPEAPHPQVEVGRWIPFTGALLCGALVLRDLIAQLR